MPPLDEGAYLYMPVTFPNISIEEAKQLVQRQDRIIADFPEVRRGEGRPRRTTDPAPLSMFETVIVLQPKAKWRPGMTRARLEKELLEAVAMPGVQSALTMPIKARVDMLTTGIRTPVGVKVFGDDLAKIEQIGQEIERRLRDVPGTPMTRTRTARTRRLRVFIDTGDSDLGGCVARRPPSPISRCRSASRPRGPGGSTQSSSSGSNPDAAPHPDHLAPGDRAALLPVRQARALPAGDDLGAVRGDRQLLAPVLPRLQHQHRGVGRHDRPHRDLYRDRLGDNRLPRRPRSVGPRRDPLDRTSSIARSTGPSCACGRCS